MPAVALSAVAFVACASISRVCVADTPPTIAGTPAGTVVAGQPYSFRPSAADLDATALAFSIANRPSWASFDASTGSLRGVPGLALAGIVFNDIRISVSDGTNRSYLPSFSIAVRAPNRAPVIAGAPLLFVPAGKGYVFEPLATDSDGDPLLFTIENRPSWASFDPRSGRLTGIPSSSLAGSVSSGVRICVSDGSTRACLPQYSIRVKAGNRAPTINGLPSGVVIAGSKFVFQPTASDPDANAVAFLIRNKPAWASFDAATGRLSGVPSATYAGKTFSKIGIVVSDGYLATALPEFSVRVIDGAGTATLRWSVPTRNTDGSRLRDIRGFRVHYGLSPSKLNGHVDVMSPSVTSVVLEDLSPAVWYFGVRTIARDYGQSSLSPVVSKRVR